MSRMRVGRRRFLPRSRLRLVAHRAHLVSRPAMTHVSHGEYRPGIEFRDLSAQAVPDRQRARGESRPVVRLGEDRECLLA